MKRLLPVFAVTALFATPAFAAEVVPLASFSGVGLNGGGHVVLRHGATQRVTILKGSTQFTQLRVKGNSLEIDACNERCPNHYDLEIEIVSPSINAVAINGGGEIETAGSFPAQGDMSAAINGGGEINVTGINSKTVQAAVQGGGHIMVTATGELTAAVSGGGQISYRGNPQLTQAVQGGGSIDRMN